MNNTLDGTFLFDPGGKNQGKGEGEEIFGGEGIKLQIAVLCEIQLKRIVTEIPNDRTAHIRSIFREIDIRQQSRTFLSHDYILHIRVFFFFFGDLELIVDETQKS